MIRELLIKKKKGGGIPWRSSGQDSVLLLPRLGFSPWSGSVPGHAARPEKQERELLILLKLKFKFTWKNKQKSQENYETEEQWGLVLIAIKIYYKNKWGKENFNCYHRSVTCNNLLQISEKIPTRLWKNEQQS